MKTNNQTAGLWWRNLALVERYGTYQCTYGSQKAVAFGLLNLTDTEPSYQPSDNEHGYMNRACLQSASKDRDCTGKGHRLLATKSVGLL